MSAIISLSYYGRNGGAYIQSVTFRETHDIHGGASMFDRGYYASAQQIAGGKGGTLERRMRI